MVISILLGLNCSVFQESLIAKLQNFKYWFLRGLNKNYLSADNYNDDYFFVWHTKISKRIYVPPKYCLCLIIDASKHVSVKGYFLFSWVYGVDTFMENLLDMDIRMSYNLRSYWKVGLHIYVSLFLETEMSD